MKVDRERLLRLLHRQDYLKKLHKNIKNSLIETLESEYLGVEDSTIKRFGNTPYLNALVNMLVANLVYSTADKFVGVICNILEEDEYLDKAEVKNES